MLVSKEIEEAVMLNIPSAFLEIKLSTDSEICRKEISRLASLKFVVLIADRQEGEVYLHMGRVRVDPDDREGYYFQEPSSSGTLFERRLLYNDLITLYRAANAGYQKEFFFRKD